MKTSLHTLLPIALLFVIGASAQVVTYDTRPNYGGSVFTFGDNGTGTGTQGETFTNVLAVKSMTYDFFAGSGGNTSATTLSAVFGQWNGSSFVAGTTVAFSNITVPPAGSAGWTSSLTNGPASNTYANFAYAFDLTSISSNLIDPTYGYLTNPNNTYALMLTNTGTQTGLGLGITNTDAFAYGATNLGFFDWTFAQLAVAPNDGSHNLPSAPEPATVAAMCGLLLVGGLAILRLRQRQLALVAVA